MILLSSFGTAQGDAHFYERKRTQLGFSMADIGDEPGTYRLKAAHMRKLADQAQHGLARSAYLALAASWLKLADRAGGSGRLYGEEERDPHKEGTA